MNIATWLHGLGLQQYEKEFRDNAIDASLLTELTEADLEKLGVLLGHRKKLLSAIDALRAARPKTNLRAGRPERRQLTVMFCDIVGSTALAVRLDPEDLREVVGAYHRCIGDAIVAFDGFVAKYRGTELSFILAILTLMRTTRSVQSAPLWHSLRALQMLLHMVIDFRCVSASPPGSL